MAPDHCEKTHPGVIDNNKILEEAAKFLKGTGTAKGFESEVYDCYLKEDVREGVDFEYCTEEMW